MASDKKVHIRGVDYESVGEGYFAEREYTERHSWMKQIIPYTLVLHEDRIFLVQRLPAGERLMRVLEETNELLFSEPEKRLSES